MQRAKQAYDAYLDRMLDTEQARRSVHASADLDADETECPACNARFATAGVTRCPECGLKFGN